MVKIYRSENNGEMVITTNVKDIDRFLSDLTPAIIDALDSQKDDEEHALHSILDNAFQLGFKLSGYKTDRVNEERLLSAGYAPPNECELIASKDDFKVKAK